jgi:glycosyltransferase involved in cell wall biosynthesis
MWLGTYERAYPRTRVLVEGLRALGADVVEHQRPLWERQEHKAGGFLRPGPLLRAGLGYLAAWAVLPVAAARGPRPDVVVAGYPAQPDAVPAWAVARATGALLVADMMISLADTLAGDRGIAGRRLGALLAGADRLTMRLADIVLCDTHAHALYFHERFGVPWAKLVVAPVGAEPGAFPPSPAPEGPPQALFYGKLSPLHGLTTVLEAARMPGVPPVRLIGDGQLGDWLRDELRRDPPPGIRWDPWVPYAHLGAEVSSAAICLGVFGTSAKAARVVPNKVWQAMAAGRPVVSADTPGIREAVTDGVSGLLVPPGDAGALAEALRRLGADPVLRARMGEDARATYLEKGAPAAAAAPLHEALRERIAARR